MGLFSSFEKLWLLLRFTQPTFRNKGSGKRVLAIGLQCETCVCKLPEIFRFRPKPVDEALKIKEI
jgi:hypothetical protein